MCLNRSCDWTSEWTHFIAHHLNDQWARFCHQNDFTSLYNFIPSISECKITWQRLLLHFFRGASHLSCWKKRSHGLSQLLILCADFPGSTVFVLLNTWDGKYCFMQYSSLIHYFERKHGYRNPSSQSLWQCSQLWPLPQLKLSDYFDN